MKAIDAERLLLRGKLKKLISSSCACSLEHRARNVRGENEQTIIFPAQHFSI